MLARLFAILIAFAPMPALACSVMQDYRVPTNFELVRDAEVVAVVRIVDGPRKYYDGGPDARVRVQPVLFLKGNAKPGEMSLEGLTWWDDAPVRPVVTTLSEAHYSVSFGGCNRQLYPVGGYALAMYKRWNGKLVQVGDPFARAVEDVAGKDDLWVRVARRYVALQAGDPATLDDRVRTEQAALLKQNDMEAQATAIDLGRYLSRDGQAGMIPQWSMWNHDLDEVTATAPLIESDRYALLSIQCSRGRGPALNYTPANAGPLALRVDDRVFETRPGKPLNGLATATTGDFIDPRGLLQALAVTGRPVAVLANGAVLREGLPADTFYRWAARCKGLRR